MTLVLGLIDFSKIRNNSGVSTEMTPLTELATLLLVLVVGVELVCLAVQCFVCCAVYT